MGGGTGGEFAQNLLLHGTEDWNKWFAFSNYADVFIEYTQNIIIDGLSLRAANDCDWRDPDFITAYYFDTLENKWIKFTEMQPTFSGRFSYWKQNLRSKVVASRFKFEFSNSKAYEIQLAEIQFLMCVDCASEYECCSNDSWRTNDKCQCDSRVECCHQYNDDWRTNPNHCICDSASDCCLGDTWVNNEKYCGPCDSTKECCTHYGDLYPHNKHCTCHSDQTCCEHYGDTYGNNP